MGNWKESGVMTSIRRELISYSYLCTNIVINNVKKVKYMALICYQ